MSKQVKIAQINSRIIAFAEKVSKAIELETNEVLEDAENIVKEFVPARAVKRTLASVEDSVEDEGVEVLFHKAVTREALKRTAGEEVTDSEIKELAQNITNAIVEELEDILKDADEVSDEEVEKIASEMGEEDKEEIEAKLKGVLERKLHAKGIYAKFARNFKKKSIAEKIREAAKRK